MFNAKIDRPDEKDVIPEEKLDQIVAAMSTVPMCCRCGAQLQGLPVGQVAPCPRCRNLMRHVGRPFLEYVSPLEVPAPGPGLGLQRLMGK